MSVYLKIKSIEWFRNNSIYYDKKFFLNSKQLDNYIKKEYNFSHYHEEEEIMNIKLRIYEVDDEVYEKEKDNIWGVDVVNIEDYPQYAI